MKAHEFAPTRFPDGSGFEVYSRLREGEPGRAWDRDVPVIMVSARGDPVIECAASPAGATTTS